MGPRLKKSRNVHNVNEIWLTFIEKGDGIIFFGQSYSVRCKRFPDSTNITNLLSPLKKRRKLK